VKKAIACLLFGGAKRKIPNGTTLRGNINILLLGDPSTAKSQFLKFVEKTVPKAIYTSGKGSSAAGLTASIAKDATSREFYLEGGAMVLADGGIVCIDEFDKMRLEDRVAIHEAMEQQTVSISKAGIHSVLNARVAVLAAANPPTGRYDDLRSVEENIDLQKTLLSRFDLIFLVRDERFLHRDISIAHHICSMHRLKDDYPNELNEQNGDMSNQLFKRFVQFAKTCIEPNITKKAENILVNQYVKYRSLRREKTLFEKKHGFEHFDSSAPNVPITVRQLEAIIRISEAFARMTLSPEVSDYHVLEAINLFESSPNQSTNINVTKVTKILYTFKMYLYRFYL
jgi:DNA replication licensing factor MCM5